MPIHTSIRTFTHDGVALRYTLRSPTNAQTAQTARPPIVFLHGLASNRSRWTELIAATTLGQNHTLLAPDLRGHGDSMTRRAFTRDDWCADVLALLDAINAPRALVVGHSLGAQVAIALACAAPARIHGIALIDPIIPQALTEKHRATVRRIPWYSRATTVFRALNRAGLYRRALPPMDLQAMDRDARIALADPDPAALAAFVKRYSATRADLKHIPHANYLQDLIELFTPLPALRLVACPTLIMRSSKADFHDVEKLNAHLAHVRHLETVTIDCHHWPVTEKPAEVRHHLERWVAAISS